MVLNLGEVVENWAQAARATTEWFPWPRHTTCRASSSSSAARSTEAAASMWKALLRVSWAVWCTLLITADTGSPGRTSSPALSPPSSAPASSAALASSSLKSLNPASFSFRQNTEMVDTATSHTALRSVMLIYWVSVWWAST